MVKTVSSNMWTTEGRIPMAYKMVEASRNRDWIYICVPSRSVQTKSLLVTSRIVIKLSIRRTQAVERGEHVHVTIGS